MELWKTDPEFMERMEHFAFTEVPGEPGQQLDDETRHLAILAALLGCQGLDEFRLALHRALDGGLSPVAVKEVVYQAVDYLGIGRVRPFLYTVNEVLTARGVALPLAGQATTTMDDRLERARRRRWTSSSTACSKHGRPDTSTACWRPTASATTTPARG